MKRLWILCFVLGGIGLSVPAWSDIRLCSDRQSGVVKFRQAEFQLDMTIPRRQNILVHRDFFTIPTTIEARYFVGFFNRGQTPFPFQIRVERRYLDPQGDLIESIRKKIKAEEVIDSELGQIAGFFKRFPPISHRMAAGSSAETWIEIRKGGDLLPGNFEFFDGYDSAPRCLPRTGTPQ